MTDESIFVTDDGAFHGKKKQAVISKADQQVLESAKTGEGVVAINSAKELKELAEAAHKTFQAFRKTVKPMTRDQAEIIRRIRVDEGYSWRAVAQVCHNLGFGNWEPPSNQLAGMAICEKAAEYFNEDYELPPWN